MALTVNVINSRSPSPGNEMRHQLQPKKIKVYIGTKDVFPSFITNKTEHFSFNSGCAVQVENDKMRRQL